MLRLLFVLGTAAVVLGLTGQFGTVRPPSSLAGMPTPMVLFIGLAAIVLLVLARSGMSRRL